jgi:putative oxidoreductase
MKRAIGWALRLGLGGLFVVTGILKLRDPAAFATAIANYQLWPQFAAVVAAILPAVEVVVGLGVLAAPRRWRHGAFVAMALMMAVFTAAAASALGRHIDIACGCFGTESGSITGWTIVRDVGILAAALAAPRLDQL